MSSALYTEAQMHFDDLNLENNKDPNLPYAQSKLGNILFTTELARRLKGTVHVIFETFVLFEMYLLKFTSNVISVVICYGTVTLMLQV